MKQTFPTCFLLLMIAGISMIPVCAQQAEDEVNSRGAFLITRARPDVPVTKEKPPPTKHKSPGSAAAAGKTPTKPAAAINSIGMGYTLYQRDADDHPVRVDPAKIFHSGDAVRLMLEPNIDGFLYIFQTENGQNPTMIFPDRRLQKGDNRIQAHVPYEIPSRTEPDPRFRWFSFTGEAATESIYLVVTREPLPGIPTGNRLVDYCAANAGACPWRPSSETWTALSSSADATRVSRSKSNGQTQTAVEAESVTRSIGLPPDAPEPSVVTLSASANSPKLVLKVDLAHQ
jgi:Domain of unknown function (DUF4384)